jgi:hypothetical protein
MKKRLAVALAPSLLFASAIAFGQTPYGQSSGRTGTTYGPGGETYIHTPGRPMGLGEKPISIRQVPRTVLEVTPISIRQVPRMVRAETRTSTHPAQLTARTDARGFTLANAIEQGRKQMGRASGPCRLNDVWD